MADKKFSEFTPEVTEVANDDLLLITDTSAGTTNKAQFGSFVTSSLSSDADNAIVEGTDGRLFVDGAGTGATLGGDNTFTGSNTFQSFVDLSGATVTQPQVGNLTVLGNTSGDAASATEVSILDDDTMATASATTLATSESVKAYTDSEIAANAPDNAQLPFFWVRFNGTGTLSINSSYNVSSVTDNATGDYIVNFTNAAADADYMFLASADGSAHGAITYDVLAVNTTDLRLRWSNQSNSVIDRNYVSIIGYNN